MATWPSTAPDFALEKCWVNDTLNVPAKACAVNNMTIYQCVWKRSWGGSKRAGGDTNPVKQNVPAKVFSTVVTSNKEISLTWRSKSSSFVVNLLLLPCPQHLEDLNQRRCNMRICFLPPGLHSSIVRSSQLISMTQQRADTHPGLDCRVSFTSFEDK